MQQRSLRNCSVERTLSVISDAWAFLVLREIYFGAKRFEQIQSTLKVSRTTLSDRLTTLVQGHVLRCAPIGDSGRTEYRLAERGVDLYPVMLAFLRFGDDWLTGKESAPITLVHDACGQECRPETICSHCGGTINSFRVTYREGPGAGQSPMDRPRRRRTPSSRVNAARRPDSVARALSILADRWTFLIIRETFFGVRRFDAFQTNLQIAPNILADRLGRLVEQRILMRIPYQSQRTRFEYKLTEVGRALYLPLIQMLRWGDKWAGFPPPLLLKHMECGHDFEPQVACDCCRKPLDLHKMRFKTNY